MIVVKLQGGLGNQMFQFAVAKSIAKKSKVYLDTEFLTSNIISVDFTKRDLELSIFRNIDIRIAGSFIKNLIKKTYPLKTLLFPSKYIYQSEKNEFINFKNLSDFHLYLDGYFQNEIYFTEIRDQLLVDFKFPALSNYNKEIAKNINSKTEAVGIHIRRGDYLNPANNAFHGLLSVEYYNSAKLKIEEKLTSPYYYIFSDDIEWCKANLNYNPSNLTFVSDKTAKNWEDMYLMSLCKHNIIANSSYSWWGAWLNKNPNKIVIAPKNWFVNHQTEIVPAQWIKI